MNRYRFFALVNGIEKRKRKFDFHCLRVGDFDSESPESFNSAEREAREIIKDALRVHDESFKIVSREVREIGEIEVVNLIKGKYQHCLF